MAFLVYFFVLLMIATSVLFGLDWVNAPLHPPAQQERTAAAQSGIDPIARQKSPPQNPPVLIGRVQPPPSSPPAKPETVGQQQPEEAVAQQRPAEPAEQPRPLERSAAAPPEPAQAEQPAQAKAPAAPAKPEPVAEQRPAPAKPEPLAQQQPPVKSEPVAQQQSQPAKPEPVAQHQSPPAKPEPVAQHQPSASPEPVAQQQPSAKSASRESAKAGTAPESQKVETKPTQPPRNTAKAAALPRGERTRAAHRSQGEQANARAPDWAVRGAEDARREAESERRAGGAPAWAIEGAETARRAQYGPPPPRPAFQPFWERENGWHFR
jgi:hypothetical protein